MNIGNKTVNGGMESEFMLKDFCAARENKVRSVVRASLLFALSSLLTLGSTASAGFYEGIESYRDGDYSKAFKEFRISAENGDAEAQFYLGKLYFSGEGVSEDKGKAAAWTRKAAKQGLASAQNSLGSMYTYGWGVVQSYKKAYGWLRKAAEQGNAAAPGLLGAFYEMGEGGVPRSDVIAYALYNLSASKDHSGSKPAERMRSKLSKKLSKAEIKAGQDITRLLAEPGKFGEALDDVTESFIKEQMM